LKDGQVSYEDAVSKSIEEGFMQEGQLPAADDRAVEGAAERQRMTRKGQPETDNEGNA
jgi:hypothetical protein